MITSAVTKQDTSSNAGGNRTRFTTNQVICLDAARIPFCRSVYSRNGNIDHHDAAEIWGKIVVRSAKKSLLWLLQPSEVSRIDDGDLEFGKSIVTARLLSRLVMNRLVIDHIRSENTVRCKTLTDLSIHQTDEEGKPVITLVDEKQSDLIELREIREMPAYVYEVVAPGLTKHQRKIARVALFNPECGFHSARLAMALYGTDDELTKAAIGRRTGEVKRAIRREFKRITGNWSPLIA